MTGPRPTMSVFVTLKDLASDGFKKLAGNVQETQKSWDKMGGAIGAVGKAFAVLGGAMAVGHFFKGAIEEATAAEEIQTRLRTAIENTGGSFDELGEPIDKTVLSMSRLTKYSDDDLKDALAHLTVTSGDAKGSLENLSLVTDLASAKHIDLKTSAELVGKVMAGETGTLSRYGIIVEEGADAIQVMRDRFGGFAEQEGKTFGGMLQRVTNGWKDFQEAVGVAILSNEGMGRSAEGVVGLLAKLEGWIKDNSAAISGFVGWVVDLGEQLWAAMQPLWSVGVGIVELADRLGIISAAIRGTKVLIAGMQFALEGLGAVVQFVFGKMQQVIGGALGLVGGVLRKFGVDVGDTADRIKASGDRMVAEAKANSDKVYANLMERLAATVVQEEAHEETRTAIARKGMEDRVGVATEGATKITKAQKDANAAVERAAKEFEAVFAEKVPSYVGAVQKALAAQNEALQQSNLLTDEQKAQLAERRAELERTLPVLQRLAQIDVDEKRVDLIEDQVEQMRVLRDLYDRTTAVIAELEPGTEGWTVATGMQLDYMKQMQGVSKEIGKEQLSQASVQRTMNIMLAVSAATMGDLAQLTDVFGTKVKKGADGSKQASDEIANAARGAIQLSVEFAGLDETSARVLTNVVNLASTLAQGFGSLAAGDIIGAIGAVSGILGSIFGGNDENKQIVRENSRRMAELRDGIREQVRLSAPGARIAAVDSALAAFGPAFAKLAADGIPNGAGGSNAVATGLLFQVAQQAGVRVSDIEQVADELGLTLRDSQGRFIAAAVNQLFTVLRTSDLTGFGTSFQGRMSQLDAEFGVRGSVSAQEELSRRMALLLEASPIFGQNLGQFNLTTTEGLQGALRALEAIVPNLGNFGIGDFGQLGREETIDWATRLADLIRSSLEAPGSGDGGLGLGGLATTFAPDTSLAGAAPVLTAETLLPASATATSDDLARTADGIERLEGRMVEVRDAILRAAARPGGGDPTGAARMDAALDALLEFVDQGLQHEIEARSFGAGVV